MTLCLPPTSPCCLAIAKGLKLRSAERSFPAQHHGTAYGNHLGFSCPQIKNRALKTERHNETQSQQKRNVKYEKQASRAHQKGVISHVMHFLTTSAETKLRIASKYINCCPVPKKKSKIQYLCIQNVKFANLHLVARRNADHLPLNTTLTLNSHAGS